MSRKSTFIPENKLLEAQRQARIRIKRADQLLIQLADGLQCSTELLANPNNAKKRLSQIMCTIKNLRMEALELDPQVEAHNTIATYNLCV